MMACLHYGRIAIIAGVGILIPWWVISAILEPVPPCCRASMERPVPHE